MPAERPQPPEAAQTQKDPVTQVDTGHQGGTGTQGGTGQVAPEDRDDGARDAAVAALEDRLHRALADLENLRKRYARERLREQAAEADRIATAWLPVLDNLDLALGYADADPSSIIEGVRSVRDHALAVLAGLGYARHDEVGVPFDPIRHEVVGLVEDPDAEPGTVIRVLRPGYGDADRQLRPGSVAVAGRQD